MTQVFSIVTVHDHPVGLPRIGQDFEAEQSPTHLRESVDGNTPLYPTKSNKAASKLNFFTVNVEEITLKGGLCAEGAFKSSRPDQ